jgi:hypothetical protein
MTVSDFLFSIPLLMCIPLLVNIYLKGDRFPEWFRHRVIIYGLIWFVYGLILRNFINENIVGMGQWDEAGHVEIGMDLSEFLSAGDWQPVWDHAEHGNQAFQSLLAVFFWITGGSGALAAAIIGFMCFWAGLILVRMVVRAAPAQARVINWDLFIVFIPSAIFWGTAALKEGLMFWSICMLFQFVRPQKRGIGMPSLIGALAALAVGLTLRPYTMVIWVLAVVWIAAINSRPLLGVLVGVIAVPVALTALQQQTAIDLSAVDVLQRAQTQAESIASVEESGSTITGSVSGMPFVGGFINLFFRPFPWTAARNLRTLLTVLEIWFIVYIIARSWLGVPMRDRMKMLRIPEIQVAILACICFSFLFTYLPNEGIIARARLQAMPALVMLAAIPAWRLRYRRETFIQIARQRRLVISELGFHP